MSEFELSNEPAPVGEEQPSLEGFVVSDGPWKLNDPRFWRTVILSADGEPIAQPLGAATEGDVHVLKAARLMYSALKQLMALELPCDSAERLLAYHAARLALNSAEGK